MSIDELELERMLARASSATPGPWRAYLEGRDHDSGSDFIKTGRDDIEMTGATRSDYDFVANARQDVPALVAEVRRLRRLVR